MISKCAACGFIEPVDQCHIMTKGAGGSKDSNNIIFMCRKTHRLQHQIGWYKFCQIYPHLIDVLNSKGWKFEEVFGVWKLRK